METTRNTNGTLAGTLTLNAAEATALNELLDEASSTLLLAGLRSNENDELGLSARLEDLRGRCLRTRLAAC